MLKILHVFSSVRLTVALLSLSMALIFFGTLDQVETGIQLTKERYFQSLLVIWSYPETWVASDKLGWIGVPMPGGYLIGPLLLLNLIAAHVSRFQWSFKKAGIQVLHAGLILLLAGGFVTDLTSEESMMTIPEGGAANTATNSHENELVFITDIGPDTQRVFSISTNGMKAGKNYEAEGFPFKAHIVEFFKNSRLAFRGTNPDIPSTPATRGVGARSGMPRDIVVTPIRPTYAQNTVNTQTAYVKITGRNGEDLGTWLVSNILDENFAPQQFEYEGKTWTFELRLHTSYFPFSVELEDFRFDRYPGTNIPKNFSSEVVVRDPDQGIERKALIYMNHPLRYGGYTFFQASFDDKTEKTTILQVVKNPGWLIPYISVALLTVGTLWQFGYHLVRFLGKRSAQTSLA